MRRLKWILAVLIVLGAGFLLAFLPYQMSLAVRTSLPLTPADRNLAFEQVALQSTDTPIALHGWWMPADKPVATMLFVHGGNGHKADPYFGALDYYARLVGRGVSVLAIDLRNHGASGASPSGRLTFGREEKFDAAAGIAWLRQRHPGLPVFATGVSMGGATLIHMDAAGIRSDGLIMIDPLLNNRDVIDRSLHAELGMPIWSLRPTSWAAERWFIGDLPNPGDVAIKSSTPMLLVSDTIDPVTVPAHARGLAAANPGVTLLLVPPTPRDAITRDQGAWAGHESALRRDPERTMAAIGAFIDRRIAETRRPATGQAR
jgi:pimeloyl-ACP methyl ester carboxylesterase